MQELFIMTGWTFVCGFVGYWIGYWIGHASRASEIRSLMRDRYYLRRWCDRLARANTELDLDLELERIRK